MSQINRILIALVISLLLPFYASAQQVQERIQSDLAIEVAFVVKDKDKTPFYVPVARADTSKGLFAIVKSPSNSEAPHFKVTSRMEGDAVNVEVFALLGNADRISSVKQIDEMPQEKIATILARQGETIQVSEVTRFGVEPLEIKVVSAKPLNLPLSNKKQPKEN